MSAVCPQGHTSAATDYCDVCGAPMADAVAAGTPGGAASGGAAVGAAPGGAASARSGPAGAAPAATAAPGPAAAGVPCPNCHTDNVAGALFCEACGYDFTTGAMPRGSGAGAASALDLDSGAAPDAVVPDPAATPDPLAPAVPLEWVAEVWVDPDWYAAQEQADQPCPSPGLPSTVPLAVRSLLIGRVSRSRNIHPEIDCGTDAAVSRRQAQLTTDGTRWFVEDLQSSNGTYVGRASDPLPTVALVPGQRRELAEDDRVYVGAWTRIVVRRATEEERAAGA